MFKSPFDEHLAKYVEEHADEPIMKRAWLLAEGRGTVQDKSDHIQNLIKMVKGGIPTPLPYDKATHLASKDRHLSGLLKRVSPEVFTSFL